MLTRPIPWRRGMAATAVIGLLVTAELWALSLPVLGNWQVDVFGSCSARSASILLDLAIMMPLGAIGLAAAWGGRTAAARAFRLARPLAVLVVLGLGLAWLRGTGWGAASVVLLAAAELALLFLLARRLFRLWSVLAGHRSQGYSHVTSMLVATTTVFRNSAMQGLLRVAIAELALLAYGTAGWFRGMNRRRARVFTSHRSEDDAVFIAVALAICIEIVPIHFLVHIYSPLAAWILTALSGYSLLWVLGDMAARRTRPHVLDARWLRLSYGLRWEAVVPLDTIVHVHEAGVEGAPQPELTIGPETHLVIELIEPVQAYGWFGSRTEARVIGIGVDDRVAFLASVLPHVRRTAA